MAQSSQITGRQQFCAQARTQRFAVVTRRKTGLFEGASAVQGTLPDLLHDPSHAHRKVERNAQSSSSELRVIPPLFGVPVRRKTPGVCDPTPTCV